MIKAIDSPIFPLKGERDSLFIGCASYEERSVLAARTLSPDYRAERAIIFRCEEYRDKGNGPEYFREMMRILETRSCNEVSELVFNIHKPTEFVAKFRRLVELFGGSGLFQAVTLDISTFPRQELLVLLRFIDMHPQRGILRLLYGEPGRYATEDGVEDESWLTRGVKSVQSVPYFGGIQFPRWSKLLVMIIGHEGERTHITLRRHQPDKLILIPQGEEQHHPGLKEIAERENDQIISIYGPHSLWKCGLPSRGVEETKQVIESIYKEHRYTHNMFVAANGTKLQLIGAYLACRRFPEIQITYAVPAIYNWQKYSSWTGRLSGIIIDPLEASEVSA